MRQLLSIPPPPCRPALLAHPEVHASSLSCAGICAVTPEDVATVCEALPTAKLVTIKPTTLGDVLGDVITISSALGVPERGERLVRMIRSRLASISDLVESSRLDSPASRPPPLRVAHVEWLAPLMGSGYWIAECVEAAGCTMVRRIRGRPLSDASPCLSVYLVPSP